jgi:Terminase small subunit
LFNVVKITTPIYLQPMPIRLPYREELFAHEVAAFTPPAKAYMAAGFKSRPEFARANACRLLRKSAVVQRVEELRAEFRGHCALQVEYLQELLLPIVEANVLDCFEAAGGPPAKTKRRKPGRKDATPALAADPGKLRFKPLDRLRREQGLAIAGLKLGENGAVVDVKFHSKTDAARALMATLGIKEGDQSAGLALVELGSRLGAALERAKGAPTGGKVIEHSTPLEPLPAAEDQDDRVVEIIDC